MKKLGLSKQQDVRVRTMSDSHLLPNIITKNRHSHYFLLFRQPALTWSKQINARKRKEKEGKKGKKHNEYLIPLRQFKELGILPTYKLHYTNAD